MHDQVQPALEVVEQRDFLAEHQQDVGRAQLVAGVAVGETRFDVLDAFESDPADQAAAATGQSIDLRNRLPPAPAVYRAQRVGTPAGLHTTPAPQSRKHMTATQA